MDDVTMEGHRAALEELKAKSRVALRARLQSLLPKPAEPEPEAAPEVEPEPDLSELEQLAGG